MKHEYSIKNIIHYFGIVRNFFETIIKVLLNYVF